MPALRPDGMVSIPAPVEISLKKSGQTATSLALGDSVRLSFDYAQNFSQHQRNFLMFYWQLDECEGHF